MMALSDPFISGLNSISALDVPAMDDLKVVLKEAYYDKNTFILKTGQYSERLYFIHEGLVKLFSESQGKTFIMRFFPEYSFFTGLDSYITQSRSTYAIVAIEPTSVSFIERNQMEALCKKHHSLETAFRKFLSIAAVNMMKRISEMLEEDGSDRYQNFVQDQPNLLQRISLGDLAAYLGITQVSLSRIRAKK